MSPAFDRDRVPRSGLILGFLLMIAGFLASGCRLTTLHDPLEQGSARFVRDSAGIVSDRRTGLQWFDMHDGMALRNWYETRDWATGLTVGGGGWRLPTMAELRTLYPEAWPTGLFRSFESWSSDLHKGITMSDEDDSTAWGYNIHYDSAGYYGRQYDSYLHSLAVRAAPHGAGQAPHSSRMALPNQGP
jgi:hypothetical protein